MEEIIRPVSEELLKAGLTEDRRLRMTNRSGNQIYIIAHQNAPNVMREIDRLGEIAFRATGGGTGLSMDIDKYDTMEHSYKQLIVWSPEAEEILGGYRYLPGTDVRFDEAEIPILATSHMFHFSDAFIKEYLPQTTELGCSFAMLEYQPMRAGSKGLFTLDNLWDGLGVPIAVMPNVKYSFSRVTMYPSYHRRGCDMALYFFKRCFNDREELVAPVEPLILETSDEELKTLFCESIFKEDYKVLNVEIRRLGYSISPLVNAYMNLSPTMCVFGAAIDCELDGVEGTGTLIVVGEVFEGKRTQHIQAFIESHPDTLKMPCESEGAFTPRVVTPQEGCCH